MIELKPNERVKAIRLYRQGLKIEQISKKMGIERKQDAIWRYLWSKGFIQKGNKR